MDLVQRMLFIFGMVILIFIACGGIGALVIWYYKIKKFPYIIILKEITNKRVIVHLTRARLIETNLGDDKIAFYHKRYSYYNAPIPDYKSIEMRDNGKKFIQGYIINERQIVWGKDTAKFEGTNPTWDYESILIKDCEEGDCKEGRTNKIDGAHLCKQHFYEKYPQEVLDTVEPYTQKQRQALMLQDRKANDRRSKSLEKIAMVAIPAFGVIIILVLVFAFWGDITAPSLQAKKMKQKEIELQSELINQMERFHRTLQGVETFEQSEPINQTMVRYDT